MLEAEEKARNDTLLALSAQEKRIRGEMAAKATKDAKRRDKQVGRCVGPLVRGRRTDRRSRVVWACWYGKKIAWAFWSLSTEIG